MVAALQAVHFLGNIVNRSGLSRKEGSRAGGAGACFLMLAGICTQNVLRLMTPVNHYAYTYVAIYGHPMVTAARDTYRLVRQVGLPRVENALEHLKH